MNRIMLLLIFQFALYGCSIMSANYIPSYSSVGKQVQPNQVQVYYDKKDIPFKYKEIGRIFLKNINGWADRDPAGQISKIRDVAAENGADAVFVENGMRREGSFASAGGYAGGQSGDVFQYSGIAIIKE